MADPVYAQVSDFGTYGINEAATRSIDSTKIAKNLSSASRKIDQFLRSQFTLPILVWGDDLREMCCVLAVWPLISGRGYNPENGVDKNIKDRYDDAMALLKLWAGGTAIPSVTDSAPGASEGRPSARPRMVSSSQRGWSSRGSSRPRGPFQGD